MKGDELLPIEGELTDEDLKQVSGAGSTSNVTGPPQNDQGQNNNDQGQNQQ
jgi:hypothetical protein